jgi:hypothetical protein
MKKDRAKRPSSPSEPPQDPDEILPEYDLTGGERGKYAARYAEGTNVVLLDPDVAAVFPSSSAVNDALRALAAIAKRHAGTDSSRRSASYEASSVKSPRK